MCTRQEEGMVHDTVIHSTPPIGGYKFKSNIDTNGYEEASGTHITADLLPMRGECDGDLFWSIQITAHLLLLNQRGNCGHVVTSLKCSVVHKVSYYREFARKFTTQSELRYNAAILSTWTIIVLLIFSIVPQSAPQRIDLIALLWWTWYTHKWKRFPTCWTLLIVCQSE